MATQTFTAWEEGVAMETQLAETQAAHGAYRGRKAHMCRFAAVIPEAQLIEARDVVASARAGGRGRQTQAAAAIP